MSALSSAPNKSQIPRLKEVITSLINWPIYCVGLALQICDADDNPGGSSSGYRHLQGVAEKGGRSGWVPPAV